MSEAGTSAKRYTSDAVTVTFVAPRCIHAAECVRGLPVVFDKNRRPWVLPGAAAAEEIAAVIERCPTGALHYERSDGGPAERPDARNRSMCGPEGPTTHVANCVCSRLTGELYFEDVRVAFCRCGQSQNKPFCDNSHIAAGFDDPGAVTVPSDCRHCRRYRY